MRAVACDVHHHRLAELKDLGADLLVLDGTQPLPFAGRFDRILVDAPCSGTGTLGRNPEIKWKLRPEDLADLQRRQKALLAQRPAPSWRRAGSWSTPPARSNPRKTKQVVAGTGARYRLPGRDAGDGFFAAVIKSDKPAND